MHHARSVAVAAIAATLLLLTPSSAHADQALDDLAATLGIQPDATDFVVIVDTSVSMKDDGRWGRAVDAVEGLLDNLTEDDHVTLITFDDGAKTVFQGLNPDPADVLAKLPDVPTGTQTDIGAAIAEGVDALDRDNAAPLAALALLTDGDLDPGENSDFPTPDAPAWAELATRAASVTEGRQVGAFALSLGPESDAGLLTQVFPNAQVATPDDIVAFLTGLNDELTRFRIAEVLAPELAAPLTVTVDNLTEADGALTATATFTSNTTNVPLTVTAIAAEPAIEGAGYGLTPATLDIAPGETQTAQLTISAPPGTQATTTLVATLTSPWQPQLAQVGLDQPLSARSAEFTVETAAAPTQPSPSATPEPETGVTPAEPDGLLADLPPWAIPAILGAVVLLAAIWAGIAAARARRPRVDGSMAVIHDGTVIDEFVVAGPRAQIKRGDLTLTATRAKDGKVEVRGHRGKEKFTARLDDGDTAGLPGGATLRYTEQRTRMLDMITDQHGTEPEVTGS